MHDATRYIKEYTRNCKDTLQTRDTILLEHTKARNYLSEKKFKRLSGEKNSWNLDENFIKEKGIELETAISDIEIARRFIFIDVF